MSKSTKNLINSMLNKFKLGNCIFKSSYAVPFHVDALWSETISQRKTVEALSKFIVENQPEGITKTTRGTETVYTAEYLVIQRKDLKSIVEGCIQLMPQDAINELRTKTPDQ